MITDWFIGLFTSITSWIASALPTNNPFAQAAGQSWTMYGTMDYFLPVHELLAVFAAVFLLGGPMLITSMFVWVTVGILRGGSTKA